MAMTALSKLDLWNAEVVTALVASATKSMVNIDGTECCNLLLVRGLSHTAHMHQTFLL